MTRHTLAHVLGGSAGTALALLLVTSVARAQDSRQPAEAQPANSFVDSLRELHAQVEELRTALAGMRAELAEARAETRRLHQELVAARLPSSSRDQGLRGLRPTERAGSAADGEVGGLPPSENVEERLAKLDEDQQLLSQKVQDQYQTKVESASKYRVRLSGIALLNLFGNRGSVDNQDLPSLARPTGLFDSGGNFGATVRQSGLGLEVFGSRLAGAKTSGEVHFDFFGGFPYVSNGVTAGLVRIRTAAVRLEWDRTSVVAGQETLFVSPLSPTSLASLAEPALSYSGNLWTWTPQVRVEHRLEISQASALLIQGGILDPLSGEPPYNQFYRSAQAGENSRQPAFATRMAWTNRVLGGPLTVGWGGYYSRQNWGFKRTVDAWVGTVDWNVPLGPWLALTGEFYRGRAIGGLGGGGGRSVAFSGPPTSATSAVHGLNTVGGWAQLKFKATEKLEFNGALGTDNAFASDLRRFPQSLSYFDPSLARNQSGFVNSIYRVRSNMLFSVEYRRLRTSDIYLDRHIADHVNVGVGVLF